MRSPGRAGTFTSRSGATTRMSSSTARHLTSSARPRATTWPVRWRSCPSSRRSSPRPSIATSGTSPASGRLSTRAGASRTARAPFAPSRAARSRRGSRIVRLRRTSTRTSRWRPRSPPASGGSSGGLTPRPRSRATPRPAVTSPRSRSRSATPSRASKPAPTRATCSAPASSITTFSPATGSAASTTAPSPNGSSSATSKLSDGGRTAKAQRRKDFWAGLRWAGRSATAGGSVSGRGRVAPPFASARQESDGELRRARPWAMVAGLVSWSFPTTIVFGSGAVGTVGEHVKRLGAKRALLVADAGVVRVGIAERVRGLLEAAGIATALFDKVDPNPVQENIVAGVAAYRAHGAECIVAVGGGAPLDAGKLIALKVTHERPLVDYDDAVDGGQFIGPDVPPIITIPTTAGTGSEVGRSGVVTLAATGRKTVIFSPYLLAKAALLDPELTQSMPPRVTAATGFDALTHCLEAYCSLGDHPMADGIALAGLELCAANLARAVEQGDDLAARGGMMKAAMMGAVAFQKGLGACHSLAHPLSSEKGMHHGLANALCLAAVVDFNESAAPARLEGVRAILDPKARTCGDAVRSLRKRVGLPDGLGHEGVSEADVPKLSAKAIEDACHRSNPRPTTRDDLAGLYRASL